MRGAVCSSSLGHDGHVTSLGGGRFRGPGPVLPTTRDVKVFFNCVIARGVSKCVQIQTDVNTT